MFLSTRFSFWDVTTVELDPVIAQVATELFGFAVGPRSHSIIGDGLTVVREAAARARAGAAVDGGDAAASPRCAYDLVVIDVDSKDLSTGMSFPPAVSQRRCGTVGASLGVEFASNAAAFAVTVADR